ncbi:hypothetical protein M8998_03220 [Sphingobacterium sp. lm-10]|uniref:sensor histidine kinase n=1 Tax=Sphingobacterium sp. lm-10 TaxID=2944904 RepID=UPI0020205B65|nr:sensor histidine kinase [Sphingobacterium sp. lm-10]MCL7986947.1 hypothetical protein [Sphingobacterium sp. lm-10]
MPYQGSAQIAPSKRILDFKIKNEQEVRDMVSAAADVCRARYATISILNDQHQYNFYNRGFDEDTIHKNHSVPHSLQQGNDVVIIENLESISYLPNRALGNAYPKINFYAGIPLHNERLEVIGYLCVYNDKSIKLTDVQRTLLITLSKQLVTLFESGQVLSSMETQFSDTDHPYIRRESLFNSTRMVTLLLDKNFSVMACHPLLATLIYDNLQRKIQVGDDIRDYIGELTMSDFLKNFDRALGGQSISLQTKSGICWGGVNSFCHFSPAYNTNGELIGVSYHALPLSSDHNNDPISRGSDSRLQWINDLQLHRFRGPLSSILGITQIWKELNKIPSNDEIDMIIQAATKLDREIQRVLLDFCKQDR